MANKKKPKWEPSERRIDGKIWVKSGNIPKTKNEAQKDKKQLKSWGLKVRVVKTIGSVHAGKYMTYIRGRVREIIPSKHARRG